MWFLNVTPILTLLITVLCVVPRDDVKYFLSTQHHNRTELNGDNLVEINVANPILVLIHGWSVESNVTWVVELTAAFLMQSNCNVIAVDYTPISQLNYISAVADSKAVGKYIAEFLANLHTNLTDLHVIGHSLGGQIAGFVGKTYRHITGQNISRITGLDPANAPYVLAMPDDRLTSTDADIVVTVHTDGLVSGYYYRIGGVDFYANGGVSPQPGCLFEDLPPARCSHSRARQFYLEAVRNPDGFIATKCSNYIFYELRLCKRNKNITLGGSFTQSDYGKYYFNTNSKSPYSKE